MMIQRYIASSGGGNRSDIDDSSMRELGDLYKVEYDCIPPVKSNPHFDVKRGWAYIFFKYKNISLLFRSKNESR